MPTPAATPTPSAPPAPAASGGPRQPSTAVTPAELAAIYAATRMQSMTLAQKIAAMFMVQVPGTDPTPMKAYLEANRPSGFLLLGNNMPGSAEALAAQLAAATSAPAATPGLAPLISIDEEGGDVARLDQDVFPGADRLKSLPVEDTGASFTQRAALLKAAGVSVNFGTVADVTADPASFIFDRVLGTDPASASARVAASVAAENGSVFSTLKHFPGHGETPADSHTSIPTTDLSMEGWQTRDMPSFAAGVDAGAPLVMFGHLTYSSVDAAPASLSVRWHEILRGELGFTGVAVTDDMLMLQHSGLPEYADATSNAVRAVSAGNDMLLYNAAIDMAPSIAAITTAVQEGQISERQIDESVVRILTLQREQRVRTHPAG
ncbi:glycoside hydrolase family 3 N-terminal domain-containing protein [Subtercola boreus]|uniref:glycoside hydrolase family 3 N-terminal domain-containing protein n=1 Tax=Subtercola boreus TaxID=120213 RepID=UPI00209BD6B9|nr:glycoside hydrolase family 3 N-terminal domain-containing protein [Subtercola boreus]